TRAKHAVFFAVVVDRQAPAGILRAETGEHRLGGVHGYHERPRRVGLGGLKRDPAKAPKANLGDASPGLQTAYRAHAAIDSALAELPFRDLDAQSVGVSDQRLDERLRLGVDAR